MLLGHSFDLRPNSRAFAIAGSVMTSGLLINECSQQKKKQFDEGKQDLLVQKFGLRRPQRQLNAREIHFSSSIKRRQKETLFIG